MELQDVLPVHNLIVHRLIKWAIKTEWEQKDMRLIGGQNPEGGGGGGG